MVTRQLFRSKKNLEELKHPKDWRFIRSQSPRTIPQRKPIKSKWKLMFHIIFNILVMNKCPIINLMAAQRGICDTSPSPRNWTMLIYAHLWSVGPYDLDPHHLWKTTHLLYFSLIWRRTPHTPVTWPEEAQAASQSITGFKHTNWENADILRIFWGVWKHSHAGHTQISCYFTN